MSLFVFNFFFFLIGCFSFLFFWLRAFIKNRLSSFFGCLVFQVVLIKRQNWFQMNNLSSFKVSLIWFGNNENYAYEVSESGKNPWKSEF